MPSPEEYQNLQERCSVLENEVKRLVKTEKKLYSIKRKYDKEIINLQKLQNLVHKLNLNFSLDEIVRIVCQALVYEFEYEKSMILLKEQNKFMIKAFTGYKEKETKMINISQINFDPVIDHLLRNQKALLIQKGGSFDPVGDHMGLSTFLISLLLTKENHIMGLLLAGISKEKLMLYSPLSEDDINLFSTLSEQVAASIENTKLYHDLKNAYEELKTTQNKLMSQESLAAIGKLASSVGHELRNPLESIKNVAYYFEKKLQPDNPTMKKFLEILKKEVVRANKIVTDILDFSRVKRLNKAMVSLNQLFQDILTSMDIDKRIKVNREIPPSVDNIYLDPDRIKQVFINIITNAIQAIPARGKINIKAEKIKHRVRIKIHDTGCGMDEKTMKHMFEPLYSSKTKGIGLGMAIVFDIIKSHDGTIQVESKVNKGTTVSIFLPLK